MREFDELLSWELYLWWLVFVTVFCVVVFMVWRTGRRFTAWATRYVRRLMVMLTFLALLLALLVINTKGCVGQGQDGPRPNGGRKSEGKRKGVDLRKAMLIEVATIPGPEIVIEIPAIDVNEPCSPGDLQRVFEEKVLPRIPTGQAVDLRSSARLPETARLLLIRMLQDGGLHVSESLPE